MPRPANVVVYFDYCCPFCYLGKMDLERLETDLGFEIDWRYYQIHPELPDEGVEISEVLGVERENLIWQDIDQHVNQRGVGRIKRPRKISNTRNAQLASESARDQGLFRAFQSAVYEAYFLDGRGIGTESEVLDLGRAVGLEPAALAGAFRNPDYLLKIRRDDEEARRTGVFGIPTVSVGGRLLMGARPYEELRDFIARWIS